MGHVQPRVAAITAFASLALYRGTGFWSSLRRLKAGGSLIRNNGQDRELIQFTAFFAWLRLIFEELASFSINYWEYYSAVVRNILNTAGGFFCEGRLPDHDPGQVEVYQFYGKSWSPSFLLSSGVPLPGGACLRFLRSMALGYLDSEAEGMPKIQGKITFFKESCAIIPSTKGLDSASKTEIWEIFPRGRGIKTHEMAKPAA